MPSVSRIRELILSKRGTVLLSLLFFLEYLICHHLLGGRVDPIWLAVLLAATGILVGTNIAYGVAWHFQEKTGSDLSSLIGQLGIYLGIVVVIIGMSYSFCYGFHGHFQVTEGSSVLEANESYQDLKTGLVRPNSEYRWAIQLERVALRYTWDGNIAEIAADVVLYDQRENKLYAGTAGPDHPISVGNLELRPVHLGVTPALAIRSASSGELVWQGAPELDILELHGKKQDSFKIPGQDLELLFSFYPAARYVQGQLVNSSLTVTNPVFLISNSDASISKPVPVGKVPVLIGGYSVEIPAFRYWLRFETQSLTGRNVILAGLALIILGLILSIRKISIAGREDVGK